MKKILLFVLILIPALLIQGQIITGLVLDQESREPIDFASVFFDGTFVGTTTDEQGQFELDVSKYASRALTISAVGYTPASINEFVKDKQHLVELVRKYVDIGEVTVSTKSLVRKRRANMRIFRNEFIGLSVNARKCQILNEEDITFNYGSCQHFFRALWANSLIESEFAVSSTRSGSILPYDAIVYEDYQGKKHLRYFDPTPIIWTGNMSEQRVADFLPYEYILTD